MPDDFQIAAERARERAGEDTWNRFSIHERSDAIYQQLRAIDAERGARPSVTSDVGPS